MKITESKLREIIREELEKVAVSEIDYTRVKIPSQAKRFMDKFTDALKKVDLNRQKQIAVLYTIIKTLDIDERELVAYISKIKGTYD